METDVLIDKICGASRFEEVGDIHEFINIIKKIHPDRCHHPKATEATAKLNELKRKHEEGEQYVDESGVFRTFGTKAIYEGSSAMLSETLRNYRMLMSRKDSASRNFQKYLPLKMVMVGGKLELTFADRSVPLSGLTMPQKHVNWVYSRMLEFSAWLAEIDYTHGGLNPETVYVVPKTHGIQVCNFCMMARTGSKITGISGKYKHWYPAAVFTEKVAKTSTDLDLSAKTSIYLLGDKSGAGTKLRREKSVNKEILEFLLAHHESASQAFSQYRDILGRNFKKEFHVLNV